MATGWIVAEFDWPVAFYAFGLLGLLWAPLWYLLVYDAPHQHPRISVSELKQITDMASTEEQKHVFPWRSFVRLPAFGLF